MDRAVTSEMSENHVPGAVAWPATEAIHNQVIGGLPLATENSVEESGVDRGSPPRALAPSARGWRQRFAGGSTPSETYIAAE